MNFQRQGWSRNKLQMKYAAYNVGILLILLLAFSGPLYWLFFKNFETLKVLTYSNTPALVTYLEREQETLVAYLFLGGGAALLGALIASFRWTAKVIFPLLLLEEHIYNLSKGNFFQPELKVRSTDDHQNLVWSYNYLYKSLRIDVLRELESLKKLQVQPEARDSFYLWQELVRKKESQLGQTLPPKLSNESKGLIYLRKTG